MVLFRNIFPQFRYTLFKKLNVPKDAAILDFGCGKPGPSLTKRWMPDSHYDGFYLLTDEVPLKSQITDNYDLVVSNHVVEHLRKPMETIHWLCTKVKQNGLIYLAFPSPHSVSLPRAKGTLNFSDDPTHIWLPDPIAICNLLMESGFRLESAGITRSPLRVIIGAFILPWALLRRALTGSMNARGLWDLLGFEYHIAARRHGQA